MRTYQLKALVKYVEQGGIRKLMIMFMIRPGTSCTRKSGSELKNDQGS
jgi:hypothetical protein